jgi:hypothetical protein
VLPTEESAIAIPENEQIVRFQNLKKKKDFDHLFKYLKQQNQA